MKYERDDDINRNWYTWDDSLRIGKGTGRRIF